MVNVYTSYKKLVNDYSNVKIVTDNDRFFIEEEPMTSGIDAEDFKLMQYIDGISFYNGDKSIDNTVSMFGPVKLQNLSTGCKTAINLRHIIRGNKQVILDITQCGANAVLACFMILNKSNYRFPVLLQHCYLSELLDRFIEHRFIYFINGEVETDDIFTLMSLACRGDS